MGAAAAGALLMLVLAYLAQSPRLLKRLQLGGQRLDLRARTFTGYALALLLLAIGFFLAGVPLGAVESGEVAVAGGEPTATPTVAVAAAAAAPEEEAIADAAEVPPAAGTGTPRPASGAFVGPPPTAPVEEAALPANPETADEAPPIEPAPAEGEAVEAAAAAELAEEAVATVPPTAAPTETPTATPTVTPSPTPTATPLPTETPTPTLTPTPIFEETATVNTGGSTLWLRRTPGGQEFVLLQSNAIVILRDGYANAGGSIWREVSTTDGAIGWVQESFLNFNAVESGE